MEQENNGESQFHILADMMPTLCWMADADGWIFWYNRRWYEYTGTTPGQMEGWGWQSVHDPEILPKVMERWKNSIASGQPFEMTFPLKSADGTFRPFLTRIAPLRGADGHVFRWLGVNTDVSEEHRTAERLAQLVEERTAALLREVEERRRAETALRHGEKLQALGQLTGGVAHDFNNILQVISAGAELMKKHSLTEERRAFILDSIVQAARNAHDLVDGLLTFSRRQALRPETFDCNERLPRMTEMLNHILGSTVSITVERAPDLWPVRADPGQFETALINLAVNARDAMRGKQGVLTLRTRNAPLEATSDRAAGDYVCVEVRDNGTGMSAAVAARVFEPFFTTKEFGKGTGLGLSQVHGFIKQSGGDIEVKSEPGEGTLITLYLPRAAAAAGPASARATAVAEGIAFQAAAGRTVLVVDDNAEVSSMAATLLELLGYTTHRATSAAHALEILEREKTIDAVFSDIMMPGAMNGIDLARFLQSHHPHVAVVLATGYSEMLSRGIDEIPADILKKPYALDELGAALMRALHRAGLGGTPLS